MSKIDVQEIKIDGKVYVPKDSIRQPADTLDGMPFVIVRSYDAGVYFGYLQEEKKGQVVLRNARNVYYWSGAATLLQMANEGVKNPGDCKFTQIVDEIKLNRVCAVIKCTKVAQDNLSGVAVWEN